MIYGLVDSLRSINDIVYQNILAVARSFLVTLAEIDNRIHSRLIKLEFDICNTCKLLNSLLCCYLVLSLVVIHSYTTNASGPMGSIDRRLRLQ